jgi:ATP-dependent exoDNAse (exonuclease V) alpha subunit
METVKKRSLAEIIAERKQQQLKAIEEKKIATAGEADEAPDASSLSSSPVISIPTKKFSLAEILAAKKAGTAPLSVEAPTVEEIQENLLSPESVELAQQEPPTEHETFSLNITLNREQTLAKELAFSGKSFVLTGAAGTGKTTAQREIAAELVRQDSLGFHEFRIQGTGERVSAPSIAFVAYTRIASGNLRRAIHKDPELERLFQHNVTTVHNLLEYTPETYMDYDEGGRMVEKFRFFPRRNASNPLDITHLIIEEATMIGVADLWPKLYEALRPDVQIIFIGDINQLQPVFGASIFNYALTQLPVIELTTVYRQKEGSSILDNAHKILRGEFPLLEDANFKIIRGGAVQHSQHKLASSLGATIPKWYQAKEYDPEQDIILCPWNKQDLGTDNINKVVAQFLGDERDAVVFEVICGIAKVYLAIGDKVLFNKQVGTISSIRRNMEYTGKAAKPESKNLLRFGAYRGEIGGDDEFELSGYENLDLDRMMDEEVGEKKKQASHIVDLEMETGITETLSAVGDFSSQSFSLGYALTVHKAQGCEWRKVFFILHKDHAISAYRELFYTAVTRSREQCILIGKDFMFEKAIKTQRIKGNTVAEKIAYFNSGITLDANVRTTK